MSLNPVPPYATWATAATNIQDAVHAAAGGDTVLVTNGVYSGGITLSQPLMTLLSVNGPQVTVIDGGYSNQCVSMASLVNLSGFTLTHGSGQAGGGIGGGSTNAYVTNCVMVSNSADIGGGAYAGTLYNCVLRSNTTAILTSQGFGGGTYQSILYNCTLSGNSADQGGGCWLGNLYNCIVYDNIARSEANFSSRATLNYCCTWPLPADGLGNITNAPLFLSEPEGNLRLQSNSPCINAGNNSLAVGTTDLDDNPRISGGTVDLGAYEFPWSGPPSIFQQPAAQNAFVGSDATFTVSAAGLAPLSWQWNMNGTAIPGATKSSLTLSALTTNQAGGYTVVVTNSMGSITSQVAVLTLLDTAPRVALQPADQTVYAGTNVTLAAGVEGSLPLSWQWLFNATSIPEATNSSLTLSAATTNQTGGYSVVITNALGAVTSRVAVLTVVAISISLQPVTQAVPAGTNVLFTAAAAGVAPFVWQWQFKGQPIPGATNPSLSLTAVTTNATGVYAVTVRNAFGSANSSGAYLFVEVPITSYVWQGSPSPTTPYTNWATAAHSIQDAIDVGASGGQVVVTNGLYVSGGHNNNRVVVNLPLMVRSVNGPAVTIIQALQSDPNNPIRCAYLGDGAVLSGFTLTGGNSGGYWSVGNPWNGGGVYCTSTNALVTNCVLTGNSAFYYGGGAFSGTLRSCLVTSNTCGIDGGGVASGNEQNCVLTDCIVTGNFGGTGGGAYADPLTSCVLNNCLVTSNSAGCQGGGAYGCTLNNCTLAGNSVTNTDCNPSLPGGGASSCALNNCILFFNTGASSPNYDTNCILNYCCTTPLPPTGSGNLASDPRFVDYAAGNLRLQSNSPCLNAGNNSFVVSTTDLDGNPRVSGGTVDLGAYEFQSSGPPSIFQQPAGQNLFAGSDVTFTIGAEGPPPLSFQWQFNGVAIAQATQSSLTLTAVTTNAAGLYSVVVTNSYGSITSAGAALNVRAGNITLLVAQTTLNPTWPFATWDTAANTIQQAVDSAWPGDTILVTNGSYSGGVSIQKPLTVLSASGPQDTVIDGGGGNYCVYSQTGGLKLSGFTLTHGVGGFYCPATNGFLTNCVLRDNQAIEGAGAFGATLYHCTLTNNHAANSGGGAESCILYNCTLAGNSASAGGAGADSSTLSNCVLSGNTGAAVGNSTAYNCTLTANSTDGAYLSTLYNCILASNYYGASQSRLYGCALRDNGSGGAEGSTLYNCILTGNANEGAGFSTLYNCTLSSNGQPGSPGAYGSTLDNCVIYYNPYLNYFSCLLNNCCTTPMPTNGIGNLTNAPLFVDQANGDFHLQPTSPCINAGNNSFVSGTTDLDGNPRVVGGTVDLGAYEFQAPTSVISYAWLQQYGLPIDGSADFVDADRDGLNNWQEWVCGTNPTNALSVLRMLSAVPDTNGIVANWQSVAGVSYFLLRSTNLNAPFTLAATNLVGQPGATAYTDTNAAGPGPLFYRIGVSHP